MSDRDDSETTFWLKWSQIPFLLPCFEALVRLRATGLFVGGGALIAILLAVLRLGGALDGASTRRTSARPWIGTLALGAGLCGFLYFRMRELPWYGVGYAATSVATAAAEAWTRKSARAPWRPLAHRETGDGQGGKRRRGRRDGRGETAADAAGNGEPRHSRLVNGLFLFWLLNLFFGSAIGWALTEFPTLTSADWTYFAAARAALCVAVPLAFLVPGLRACRRPPSTRGATFVFLLLTGFQVATGAGAAYDLVRGPVWQDVEAVEIRAVESGRFRKRVSSFARLADGREFRLPDGFARGVGPRRYLVLRGLARLLDES